LFVQVQMPRALLDLNLSPQEEEEEDVKIQEKEDAEIHGDQHAQIQEEEHMQIQEEDAQIQEEEHEQAYHRELPDSHRFAAYIALKALGKGGKVEKGDKKLVAALLQTSLSTIDRIWKKAIGQEKEGLQVDVSNQKKGRVGRKRANLGLSRMTSIPLNQRSTLRSLARELGVAYSTLQRRFQWGKIKRHTSTLKPALKPENKIERLKFCTSMIDQTMITEEEPSFLSMENIVHIDEKWFDMTMRSRTYYLLPEEHDLVRTIHNKNSKVMFLTAVAKPRFNEKREVTLMEKSESGLLSKKLQPNTTPRIGSKERWN
jgi:hypothetical protein